MEGQPTSPALPDFRNVQAMVTHLYKCPISRHLVFRFGDRDGARAFLRQLTPGVTMADFQFDSTPDPLLNIGITFTGLTVLGVDPALLDEFDAAYKAGPAALALGDALGSQSDPANWWEDQFKTEDVHCIVHLYLRSDSAVEPASAAIRPCSPIGSEGARSQKRRNSPRRTLSGRWQASFRIR